jgi:hypothetical protein
MPNNAKGIVIRPTIKYAIQPFDLFLILLNIISTLNISEDFYLQPILLKALYYTYSSD